MELGMLGEAIRAEDAVLAALIAVPAAVLMAWWRRRGERRGRVALRLDD